MNISHNLERSQSTNSEDGSETISEIESKCFSHMASNGIQFEGPLIQDGEIHRFSIDQSRDKAEWYIAFSGVSSKGNPYLNCVYGSFREGGKHNFNSWEKENYIDEQERKTIQQDWEQRKKEIETKRKRVEEERQIKIKGYWDTAQEQPLHQDQRAYLERKKVKGHGVKYGKDFNDNFALIIPLRNINGEVQGIQFIRANGEKRFHGLKRGNFHLIGEVKDESLLFISEGYATASSVYEAKGWPVVVAFDCGNLDPVIDEIRKKYSRNQIVIIADDDCETDGNPGRTKAREAAKKYGCKLIIPKFPNDFRLANGKLPTDFNDLHVNFDLDEVKKQLPQKKSHLNPIDIGSFLSLKMPPRHLLLNPWLPEQGLAMIYAQRGVGKTYVALSIAYAIASGGSIFKWIAPEPRRVLYIDGEMPASTMQERLANIARASDKQLPDPTYFKLVTPDLSEAGIRDLSTLEGQIDINEYLNDFDLIIIDNLSTLVRSGRENESESWLPVQEWALDLRRMGKSVLFVHHAGKGGQQRGTSKKEDVLDTVINLKHPKDYSPKDGARFEIHFEKARGFDGDAAKPFEVSLNNKDEQLEWGFKEVDDRDFEVAIDLHNDGMSITDIAQEIGVNKSTVSRWIKKAKNEGRIKR